ncbi:hypothetical protein K493DRAFT_306634 [Basidiobolus meristosporus CBS 931.73]|uniref:Uncharacterized protein n=1 Tax=Basidiobolus meristosporus CBS 931.73 TaxID=1314790 RepID=A0A1Y1XRR1_9FUNG|nr:hypothetical protein K493DRAFT_306634 [Basidiobolus meristosporus CBS 931.73]|eukprot:ORX88448.1 hypothetical protein K493DRAFT_306634 [Basidiobolus meristosporus CBS 931.73]
MCKWPDDISCYLYPSFTVENYDPATDYFPDKVTFNIETERSIEYRMNWKYVQLSSTDKYILYQRGTPQPQRISQYDKFFEIPLNRVGNVGPTEASYLDRRILTHGSFKTLGLVERIVSAYPQYFTSPCIANNSFDENVDAYFTPDIDVDGNKTINIYEEVTASPLTKSDLLKVYSVFFNLERVANNVTQSIHDNYDCIKNEVQLMADKTTPKGCLGLFDRCYRRNILYALHSWLLKSFDAG